MGGIRCELRGVIGQFHHRKKLGTVTISGKLSVDVPPGTLNSVRKQAGLMDEVMRYLVIIEKGDSSWGAHVPDLPGCIAAAKTREEVIKVIKEAIEFHIDGLRKHGDPIPPPSSEGQFVDTDAA